MMQGIRHATARRLAGGVVLTALFLAACSGGDGSGGRSGFQVAVPPGAPHSLVQLAGERGHLEADGRKLVVERKASEAAAMEALADGSVDVACLGLDELIELRSREVDAKGFLVTSVSQGSSALVGKKDRTDIKKLQGIPLAHVAGSDSELLIRVAARYDGLELSSFKLVEVPAGQLGAALDDGRAQAAAADDYELSQLLRREGMHKVVDTADHMDFRATLLVATAETLANHPDEVRLLVEGWLKVLQEARADAEGSIREIARIEGQSEDDVRLLMPAIELGGRDTNRRFFGVDVHPSSLVAWQQVTRFLREKGRTDRSPASQRGFDQSFLGPVIEAEDDGTGAGSDG